MCNVWYASKWVVYHRSCSVNINKEALLLTLLNIDVEGFMNEFNTFWCLTVEFSTAVNSAKDPVLCDKLLHCENFML